MKRYTKNNHPVTTVNARLIQKKNYKYFQNPGYIPSPEDMFEVVFQTEDTDTDTLEVSLFEYNVLKEGMTGELVYQGYELLRLGDYIGNSNWKKA